MRPVTWTEAAFAALWMAVCWVLSGCIPVAPSVVVTPANADRVKACETIASEHNAYVAASIILGSLGSTAAGVGAALPTTNTDLKDGVTAGSAGVGALVMALTGLVAMTASAFTDSHCSDVVGDLPLAVSTPAPTDGGM